MTKSKSYNRIVFLTTLSVYLGLVLVGGTAPVLAHSALTRSFDVQNEIELQDELDNKPDDLIAQSIIGIINDLDNFAKSKTFDWDDRSALRIEGLNFCPSDNSPVFEGSASSNVTTEISRAIDKHNVQIGRKLNKLRSDSSGLGDFHKGFPEGISFALLTENRALNLEITVNIKNDESAKQFFNLVNSSVSQKRALWKESKLAVIYENTLISTKNDQVFIVTRLPRGSIDSLLARK